MVDDRFIIGSYCLNDNVCIIFTKYLKFYKFTYSDSSLIEFNDISQSTLFADNVKIGVNKALDEVNLFEKEQINFSELNFKTCNLIIGDFIIKKDDDVLFVISRAV